MTVDFRNKAGVPEAARISAALGISIRALLEQAASPKARPGMFANRMLHSPQELRDEQRACQAPAFQGILGDPRIEKRISHAEAAARSTPNLGIGSDIPANGSEQSFYAGKRPIFGTVTGPMSTLRRELESPFDPSDMPWGASSMTAIHTHQSPRGDAGLSQPDIDLTQPWPAAQNVNIVAVDRNGIRYCKVAG